MHEIDFLAVGETKPGDAIALRFVRPDNAQWGHVIIDAGFQENGEALVEHVKRHYGTSAVELAILTHPDGDHIGGMGEVLKGLDVAQLWLHDIGAHGGSSLPAAKAVKDLIARAGVEGTEVFEVWAGAEAFGGALRVLGPDKPYYEQLVKEQVEGVGVAEAAVKAAVVAVRGIWDRVADRLGDEIPFPEKEVTPRNNSSIISLLTLENNRLLFTGDAGVPALTRAWDFAEEKGISGELSFIQIPHHGSRRNASSACLDRLLGPTGQAPTRSAYISVPRTSEKHPSGRVVNAYARRGCNVNVTAGNGLCNFGDVPMRDGWFPAPPLGPMVEEADDPE